MVELGVKGTRGRGWTRKADLVTREQHCLQAHGQAELQGGWEGVSREFMSAAGT